MLFSVNQNPTPDKRETNTPEEAAKYDRYIRIATIAVIALAAVFLINMLSTRVFAPSSNYKNGVLAMQEGNYAEAVERFAAAGDYKDAADQLAAAKQAYANVLAGKENALSYASASMPWLSVTADGMFAFAKDDYEKVQSLLPNPGEVIIPDVLDGMIYIVAIASMVILAICVIAFVAYLILGVAYYATKGEITQTGISYDIDDVESIKESSSEEVKNR